MASLDVSAFGLRELVTMNSLPSSGCLSTKLEDKPEGFKHAIDNLMKLDLRCQLKTDAVLTKLFSTRRIALAVHLNQPPASHT